LGFNSWVVSLYMFGMENLCLKENLKYIEQLDNGHWVVRYGIVAAGTTPDGRNVVTFTTSEYPQKPTIEQIRKSIHRFAMAHLDDENILESVANPDLSVYQYLESDTFRLPKNNTITFEKEDDYEDY